jgi:hypothetical protein
MCQANAMIALTEMNANGVGSAIDAQFVHKEMANCCHSLPFLMAYMLKQGWGTFLTGKRPIPGENYIVSIQPVSLHHHSNDIEGPMIHFLSDR